MAQDDFASLRKNVNIRAKGLNHDLNKTKDTLILSSQNKIYRIYTVGDNSGVVDRTVNDLEMKMPLRSLKKGKYVFVVDQLNLKIVFQIQIHKDFSEETVLAFNSQNEPEEMNSTSLSLNSEEMVLANKMKIRESGFPLQNGQ